MRTTLREIIAANPHWLDLPVAIYCPDGRLDFVGEAGTAYTGTHNNDDEKDVTTATDNFEVLIFAAN